MILTLSALFCNLNSSLNYFKLINYAGMVQRIQNFLCSVPLPQNFRVADSIAVSATFITAVIIAFMLVRSQINSKIGL